MDKKVIYIGASIFGALGSYLGGLIDGGNLLGIWSILGGLVGGMLGIYMAYKFQQ